MRPLDFVIIFLLVLLIIVSVYNYKINHQNEIFFDKLPNETATQLATTITVLRPSFMTVSQIENFLKGTGLAGYGYAFLKAEEISGIGADYLVAIACHESKFGTNTWWKEWNNCLSWGITDSGPNSEAYKIKGMTKDQAIVYTAQRIKESYLTKGGAYYSGETLSAINKYYASDTSWASKVMSIHSRLISTLSEEQRAKQWIMASRILNGNLPIPQYFTTDYWTKSLTREELAIILWRIQNK